MLTFGRIPVLLWSDGSFIRKLHSSSFQLDTRESTTMIFSFFLHPFLKKNPGICDLTEICLVYGLDQQIWGQLPPPHVLTCTDVV